TVGLLARYRLELVLAVRPWEASALPAVARALADAGVPLSIWPMLADEEGRWVSVENTPAFARFVRSLCDALPGGAAHDVLFDLEPPFSRTHALARIAGSRERD